VTDQDTIRPVDRPPSGHPGILLVRGSFAPDGGVAKRTGADYGARRFSGLAKGQEGLTGIGTARSSRGGCSC
jgi:dihydroxyacid dehydratase/phosphogluconate dehydratase